MSTKSWITGAQMSKEHLETSFNEKEQLISSVNNAHRKKEFPMEQFDVPPRSVSNVTVVPSMHISWSGISAYVTEEYKKRSWWRRCCSSAKDIEGNKNSAKTQVLNDVFGSAQPGEIFAILGPSGAGKTTLLNILTQRNTGALEVQGDVRVNGLRVNRNYMKKISGYVQQDDCFIGSLTVEEHLLFNARLRMDDKYSLNEQKRRVKQVIADLGLRPCADSLIGTRSLKGLSGGEKKRLSFASEILTSPPVLFCDEPTSGLDSFLAFQVISVLKRLAEKKGMTVILTIHQPSSQVFELFDRVYLMSEGRVAFCGSQSDAYSMWNGMNMIVPINFNPSDYYISTLSITSEQNEQRQRNKITEICSTYRSSQIAEAIKAEYSTSDGRVRGESEEYHQWRKEVREKGDGEPQYHASYARQLMELTKRNFRTVSREPTVLKVQLTQSIIIAILTGLVYLENSLTQKQVMNINGSLFQMVSEMAFMFQFSAVRLFCIEFPTFYREYGSNLYSVSAYYLAKNFADIPAYTVYATVFGIIVYFMSRLVIAWDAILINITVAILIQNVAVSIGYMVSCVFGTIPMALAVLPIFVVPSLVFGGFFINDASLPVFFQPLKYINHIKYGFETVVVNQWSRVSNISGCTDEVAGQCYRNGTDVIDSLSFNKNAMFLDILLLILMVFILRFIGYLGILIRAKRR